MKAVAKLEIAIDITARAALVRLRVRNSEALFEAFALSDGTARAFAELPAFGHELSRPLHQPAWAVVGHGCILGGSTLA